MLTYWQCQQELILKFTGRLVDQKLRLNFLRWKSFSRKLGCLLLSSSTDSMKSVYLRRDNRLYLKPSDGVSHGGDSDLNPRPSGSAAT